MPTPEQRLIFPDGAGWCMLCGNLIRPGHALDHFTESRDMAHLVIGAAMQAVWDDRVVPATVPR